MADYIKKAVPLNLFEKKSNLEKIKVSTPTILRRLREQKEQPKVNKVLFLDPKSKSIIRIPIPNNININISNRNKYNSIIKDMNNLKNKIEELKQKKLKKKQEKKNKKIKRKNDPSVNQVRVVQTEKRKITKI